MLFMEFIQFSNVPNWTIWTWLVLDITDYRFIPISEQPTREHMSLPVLKPKTNRNNSYRQ